MATQALKERASAAFELDEAIRQAKRYLKSHQPSTRSIQQKMDRITQNEEALRHRHVIYCDKASIELNSEDASGFLGKKTDEANDVVDECAAFIEQKSEISLMEMESTRKEEQTRESTNLQ